jgi:uncharacterized protein with ACT and thioredoxin-like domain
MSVLNRTTSKPAKARKTVATKAKKTKKQVRRWGIKKVVQKFVPKRVVVIAGGAFAAVVAATVAKKKRKGPDSPQP